MKAMRAPRMRNAATIPTTIPPTAPGGTPFVPVWMVKVAVVVTVLGVMVVVL
jgi:hypothetical protein